MSSETMYRLLVITVFILLVTVGLYIGVTYNQNNKKETIVSSTDDVKIYETEAKKEDEEDEELIDVSVNYVDIYSECGHEFENSKKEKKTKVEDVKNKIEQSGTKYTLVGEQDNVLVFERIHSGKCTNHYKVLLGNDNVVVYRINEKGEYSLYQETDIIKNMIREDLIERLQEGIFIDGVEELFILMEDIES